MYRLIGINQNLETLLVLGRAAGDENEILSCARLKEAYHLYLRRHQPAVTLPPSGRLRLTADPAITAPLIELFGQTSKLNDLNQTSAIESPIGGDAEWIVSRAQDALAALGGLDPTLHQLFSVVINYCFFAGSTRAGGGSSSGAIGCVWMNPRQHWTMQDFCEFFVHELTHNLLFLDERRFLHYPSYEALKDERNFAYSSILNRPRPLDKVVHSLIVASEVLAFRLEHFNPGARTFLHPSTVRLGTGIAKTIESLRELPRSIMTDRAWALIDRVEEKWSPSQNSLQLSV